MKKIMFPVIALILSIVVTASSLYLAYILDIDVFGNINVRKPSIIERDIELNIDSEVGSKIYELGVIDIPRNISMQIKGELLSYKGNIKLLLNGILELKSEKISYRINMPCLASINESCYRVTMIIPGYDVPLTVVAGKYSVTLVLSWKADGVGNFHFKLVGFYN